MEKFRIKYLTNIHLNIMQMGDNVLDEIAYYSCILGSLCQMAISILILVIYQQYDFGVVVHLTDKLPQTQTFYVIIITISLFLKVALIGGIFAFTRSTNLTLKKVVLALLSLFDLIIFVVDSFTLGIVLEDELYLVVFAAINVFLSLLFRFLNQTASLNYSFIYPYPFKKMPTFFSTMFLSILQVLFTIFEVRMKNDTLMILFFVVAGIKFLAQSKFFFQVPYLDNNILLFKLIVFNNWVCLVITQAGSIIFQIISENAIVFFCVIFIFFLIFLYTCMTYLKEKRLVLDIETAQNWEDVNIKVQYSYELIFRDKLDKMSTISKQHFQKCKIPDCRCKWPQMQSPIDFRHKVFSNKSELFQLKVFLKYYLLVLCQNFKRRFSQISQAWVVYISGLSLLNLYPKLLYQSSYFQNSFSNQVGFSQKQIVNFMKTQVLQFIDQRNSKDSVLEIERIKKVQELNVSLSDQIKKMIEIKQKIWFSLLENPVQQDTIEELFRSEIDQRNVILKIYNQIIQIPHRKLELWRTMTTYCKNIIEDNDFERVVRKNVSKQDLIIKNTQGVIDDKQDSQPRKIEQFLDLEENYCLLKLSMNEKNMGCIQWHNENFYSMLGFPKTRRLVGQSIDLLIPDIFKEFHSNVIKQWYEYPRTHKLNRLIQAYIRTNIRQFQSVYLYIKILAQQDDYGIFVIISQKTHERFIVLNEYLEDVLSTNFIQQKLKGSIFHDNLMLSLLSKDYCKLKDVKSKKYQQHTLRFPLITNYDQYYDQYCQQVAALDHDLSKQQKKLEKQNIVQRFASSLARVQDVQWLQMDVQVKSITIKQKDKTNNYILVKQSIDEQSYNDENQKLKKKRDNNNSTFNMQSSQVFEPNNLKTREKKVLEPQDNQSSISSTKNLTSRDFITKLNNKELVWLQKAFYWCLFIYFFCQIVRLIQFFNFSSQFSQLITAEISLGTIFQKAESVYDMSLYNAYTTVNTGTGIPFSKSPTFVATTIYNYYEIVARLQQQSYQIHNNEMKRFSSSTLSWTATNSETHQFPITLWFQSYGRISQIVSGKNALSNPYMDILKTNYPFLRKAAHKFSQYFMDKAVSLTDVLKYINIFILPLILITILAILFFYNKYLNQKQKIRFDFIRIFTEIDPSSIKNYAKQYTQLQQQMLQSQQQIQQQPQTIHFSKKSMINKSKPRQLYRLYMIIICLIITFDVIGSIFSYIKSDQIFQAFKIGSEIKQSFFYEIQSLIQIKQLAMGLRTYQQQLSLTQLNKNGFKQFKDNALKIFNQFNNKKITNTNSKLFKLLLINICDVLRSNFTENLNLICDNQFTLEIYRSGIMTFSHYIVDVLLEQTSKFVSTFGEQAKGSSPEIMKNSSLADASISLTHRITITQQIQKQIQEIIKIYEYQLKEITVQMVICTVLSILVLVILGYFFKKKQNKQWQYIYGSLLIVPVKQLLKASTISKMVAQLKDKSLK